MKRYFATTSEAKKKAQRDNLWVYPTQNGELVVANLDFVTKKGWFVPNGLSNNRPL